MNSDGVPAKDVKCINCGAQLGPTAQICWLCFAPAPSVINARDLRTEGASIKEVAAGGFSLASLLMFVTLVAVVLGVGSRWPGLGIPLGVFSLAVWIRTARRVRGRELEGEELTALDKVTMFLSSVAGTFVILLLVAVAGVAALFVACLALMAKG